MQPPAGRGGGPRAARRDDPRRARRARVHAPPVQGARAARGHLHPHRRPPAATQFEHVVYALSQFDPADVYGVYRVAERFGLGRGNEGKLYLEWEIAHRPGAQGASAVFTRAFRRDSHWVDRANGEPSVTDEDVAGALVDRARLNARGLLRDHPPAAAARGDLRRRRPQLPQGHIEGVAAVHAHRPRGAAPRADGAGAARHAPARAVSPRDPRLGGGRGVGVAVPLRPGAHPLTAPAPAERPARAAHVLPGDRRRAQRGLLRRPDHPQRREPDRRPLDRELPPQPRPQAEAPVRRRTGPRADDRRPSTS